MQHRKGRGGRTLHSKEVQFLLALFSQHSGLWYNSPYLFYVICCSHLPLTFGSLFFLTCVCVCLRGKALGLGLRLVGFFFFFFYLLSQAFFKNGANPRRRVWAVRACPQIRVEREPARQPDQSAEHGRRRKNQGGDQLEWSGVKEEEEGCGGEGGEDHMGSDGIQVGHCCGWMKLQELPPPRAPSPFPPPPLLLPHWQHDAEEHWSDAARRTGRLAAQPPQLFVCFIFPCRISVSWSGVCRRSKNTVQNLRRRFMSQEVDVS